MSEETNAVEGGEDSAVIKELRAQIKALKSEASSAAEEARAQVKRELSAQALVPEQFAQLTPYYLQETDGEVSKESIDQWLSAKGLVASPEPAQEDPAAAVQSVTDLAGAIDAAPSLTNANRDVLEQIAAAGEGLSGWDLPELTGRLDAILNGNQS